MGGIRSDSEAVAGRRHLPQNKWKNCTATCWILSTSKRNSPSSSTWSVSSMEEEEEERSNFEFDKFQVLSYINYRF